MSHRFHPNKCRTNKHKGRANAPRAPKFEGRCEDLKGHIYDCSDSKQADMCTKTTREIAEYIGRTYKYGSDVRLAIENLEIPTIEEPEDPEAGATRAHEEGNQIVWKERR